MKIVVTLLFLTCFAGAAISQNKEVLVIACGTTEAEYPGGLAALRKHYCKVITRAYKDIEEKNPVEGQAMITFKIDTTGIVKIEGFKKSIRADIDSILVHAIISAGPWVPATQSGRKAISYKMQKFTFCAGSYGSCMPSGRAVCR
ncbi:hypothetical protein ACTJIJ_04510 [Niabella sp. 22666]|uniref:hypothetical protein n=1 Tax=Niabella sp. 22666 TaxID=3453954 RepID=UPI003F84D85A